MEVVIPNVRAAALNIGRRSGCVQSWGAAVMTPGEYMCMIANRDTMRRV